jgi:hypothetical protein
VFKWLQKCQVIPHLVHIGMSDFPSNIRPLLVWGLLLPNSLERVENAAPTSQVYSSSTVIQMITEYHILYYFPEHLITAFLHTILYSLSPPALCSYVSSPLCLPELQSTYIHCLHLVVYHVWWYLQYKNKNKPVELLTLVLFDSLYQFQS